VKPGIPHPPYLMMAVTEDATVDTSLIPGRSSAFCAGSVLPYKPVSAELNASPKVALRRCDHGVRFRWSQAV
jgi:hypothetical protein